MNKVMHAKIKYKTSNWADYNHSLKVRRSVLTIWLGRDTSWFAEIIGKRELTFSDAAIQLCLHIKCLFGLTLRLSLDQKSIAFSRFELASVRLRRCWLVPIKSENSTGLLARSTGIKFLSEGEWKQSDAEYLHVSGERSIWRLTSAPWRCVSLNLSPLHSWS
jgi:hypothetical protein